MGAERFNTADLIEKDKRLYHPNVIDAQRVIIVGGDGCIVRDSTGREYLDCHSASWTTQVGHGRKELIDAAHRQLQAIPMYSPYWEFANEPAIELADWLVKKSPRNLTHVRYGSSGSECDDEAMQMVRHYHRSRGEPERTIILTHKGCYHGRSSGAWTLAGHGDPSMFKDGIVYQLTQPLPYHTEQYKGQSLTDYCVRELEETISRIGARRIAGLFGELVIGPGGMTAPPKDYWPRMAEVLRRNGILFVADEVVSAFGRCGDWFAANIYGVEPDIIVMAKGIASGYIPLGAILHTTDVAEGVKTLYSGGSYGGHATACAAAVANMQVIEREDLCRNARERGAQFLAELQPLLDLPFVGDVRGSGLMMAIELVRNKTSREPVTSVSYTDFSRAMRDKHGILIGTFGNHIVIMPPLVITAAQVSRVTRSIGAVLHDLANDPELKAELAGA